MSGYSFTPEQDALIQAIWGATTMKARRDAMATLLPKLLKTGITHDQAYNRAREQLWLYPLKTKGASWSSEEIAILEASAHCSASAIRRRLAKRGYQRTDNAINMQRRDLIGSRGDARHAAGIYSANQAAELIGSDRGLIASYIRRGWIKATRNQNDTFDIPAKALRDFIRDYTAYVNLDRADKYAFIDLMFPTHGAKQAASQAKATSAPAQEYSEAA